MSTGVVDVLRQRYRENRRAVKNVNGSVTLTALDSGSLMTVTAAATVTLPAVADASGCEFLIFNASDTNLTITAPSGTLVAFNNATATSIAFSTSGEKIGSGVILFCDGTKYYCFVALGAETATPTIS